MIYELVYSPKEFQASSKSHCSQNRYAAAITMINCLCVIEKNSVNNRHSSNCCRAGEDFEQAERCSCYADSVISNSLQFYLVLKVPYHDWLSITRSAHCCAS